MKRRLGLHADADMEMAGTIEEGHHQVQPVLCLLKSGLIESLVAYLNAGERRIDRWRAQHRCVTVPFEDPAAFANANTLDELQRLG